jgi:hypothetical protein
MVYHNQNITNPDTIKTCMQMCLVYGNKIVQMYLVYYNKIIV